MVMRVGSQASLQFHKQEAAWAGGGTQNLFSSHPLSSQAYLLKVLQPPQTAPHLETESSNGSLWGTFHIVHIGAWFQPLSAVEADARAGGALNYLRKGLSLFLFV